MTPSNKSTPGQNTLVIFENKSDRRVKLYWISYDDQLTLYGQIDAGASRQQNTYSDATWLIADESEKPPGYFRSVVDEAVAVIPATK